MYCVDTLELYKVAESEGIVIEEWSFSPPLEAIYWKGPELPPTIGLSTQVLSEEKYHRSVLAEELGHYFTTAGTHLSYKHMNYRERLAVSKIEHKAVRWAAEFLMPINLLMRLVDKEGCCHGHNLSEHFNVSVELACFRINLPDVIELSRCV